ncbi:MAG: hypothetical protein R6U29_07420 [Desulfosudaceae bacterium]
MINKELDRKIRKIFPEIDATDTDIEINFDKNSELWVIDTQNTAQQRLRILLDQSSFSKVHGIQ